MNVTLRRFGELNKSTMGLLFIEGLPIVLCTVERPWLNNADDISCIPAGKYKVIPHGWEPGNPNHFAKVKVWQIVGVKDRDGILFHVANRAIELKGCVGVGMGVVISQTDSAVQSSDDAIKLMQRTIGNQGFDLEVIATPPVAA